MPTSPEAGSTVERLRNPPFVKFHDSEFGHDYRVAREDDLCALLAVVEAAQAWSERDDRSCPHSDVQECVNCEMEIYDLAQAIKPTLKALHSQASDEGKAT
jgi:hypothetical protein